MVFIFLSGINALCLSSFGVFGATKITLFALCYAIVLVNIFFSLFLFCGEGIWISQCRHCFGLQAKRSVCAAHSIWLNIINRKNEEVPCGNEVTRLFLLISINAPLHKLVSWMADMLIRAGHCLSTLIIDKILGYQKANLRHI